MREKDEIDDIGSTGMSDSADTAQPGFEEASPRDLAQFLSCAMESGEADDQSPLRIDGYQIQGLLGEGGMGVVWRATQLGTGREVALKVMRAGVFGSREARARFRGEIELTARLEHPHIARLYDSGISRGAYYYAMELIDDALPLDQYAALSTLSRRELLELFVRVCQAVQHAHERGVIHRDLKPSNILVGRADGAPHLLDFGLGAGDGGTQWSQSMSLGRHVVGTLGFVPPEMAAGAGKMFDTRGDVYSLGALLFFLLTGRTPHDLDGPPLAVLRRIAEQEPLRPRSLDRSIDADLEAILLTALTSDPARRYGAAASLAQDLTGYLAGQPISARPPTLVYFAAKAIRRHRVPALAGAAFAAALVGVVIWSQVNILREKNVAIRAGAIADAQRGIADGQRRIAEQRQADGLLAQGTAFAAAGRWPDAVLRYDEARDALATQGRSVLPADIGLVGAYRFSPPPVNVYGAYRGRITSVAISPNGGICAAGSEDGTVMLWDTPTARGLGTLDAGRGAIQAIAFSGDGRRLVSGSQHGTVIVWDADRRAAIARFDHGAEVLAVACTSGGDRAASAGADTMVDVWDVGSGHKVAEARHVGAAQCVAFCPDGRTCLSGAGYGCVGTWNAETGGGFLKLSDAGGAAAASVAFSPDGRTGVVGFINIPKRGGGGVKQYDIASVRQLGEFKNLTCGAEQVSFGGDGGTILVSGSDGILRTWSVARKDWGQNISVNGITPHVVAFTRDGRFALTGHGDGCARLWSMRGDLTTIDVGPRAPNLAIAVRGDGRIIAQSNSNELTIRDGATGRPLARCTGHRGNVQSVAVSPDGQWVLSGDDQGFVRLWSGEDGSDLGTLGRHDGDVRAVAFSSDDRLGLSINGNGLKIWDLAGRRELRNFKAPETFEGIIGLAADRQVYCVTAHAKVVACDLQTGKVLLPICKLQSPGGRPGSGLSFRPGLSGVIGCLGSDLVLWDIATGRQARRFTGHGGEVLATAFSPDGQLIASGGVDGLVKLWDTDSGRELLSLEGNDQFVTHLALAEEGRKLVIFGNDRQIRILDLARPAAYREFEPRLAAARQVLQSNPDGPAALATLGEWYAFRRQWPEASRLLERARDHGGTISALTLARCYWNDDKPREAAEQFDLAAERREAPLPYLRQCAEAARADAARADAASRGAP